MVAQGNGTASDTSTLGGVAANTVVLHASTITGNFGGNGGAVPLDVLSKHRPVLRTTTCDHSGKGFGLDPIPTWGVCAAD